MSDSERIIEPNQKGPEEIKKKRKMSQGGFKWFSEKD